MNKTICFLSVVFVFQACKKKEEVSQPALKNDIPEFYAAAPEADYGKKAPVFRLIAGSSQMIQTPQDLDFNPLRENELWILNKGDIYGGSTVMLTNAGMQNQAYDYRQDGNALHFMANPSAISFSNNGFWATSPNILDANYGSGTFTGPTLWSSDLNIYAKPSGGNGSHMDMLHGSPFSMGIEAERDNIYWLYDSYHQHIVRYDFAKDHGPGMDDHSDGIIHRFKEVKVTRNQSELPSHLVLDKDKKWLYIVDGGNKRILRMDITTGYKKDELPLINEMLAQHWEFAGAKWEIVVSSSFGFKNPCGIEINGNRLFVSDYTSGDIYCFNANTGELIDKLATGNPGIIGVKIDKHSRLWYVNEITSEVMLVVPQ